MSLDGIFPIDVWNFKIPNLLASLTIEEFERLTHKAVEKKYRSGQLLFKEQTWPKWIYYIKEGKVKKYKIDREWDEHIFHIATDGELVGYHAVLAEEKYPDAACALEESVVLCIPINDFKEFLSSNPVFMLKLLSALSHEFSIFINSLSVFAKRPVRERMVITLIILREKFKTDNSTGQTVSIKMSRADIAGMAGTTRENVARVLTEFREVGIIATPKRTIIILDVRKLAAIANLMQ